MGLSSEKIKEIIEGAPEGWTHYCTRNRQYFKRHCNTKNISLWIRVNEEWSMTLESKMRWLERRERLEEILTLRQRVDELEQERDDALNKFHVIADKHGEPDSYKCVVYDMEDPELKIKSKLKSMGWTPPDKE